VRGIPSGYRTDSFRRADLSKINWSLQVMGMGAAFDDENGYALETLSWSLVHWLVDTKPDQFEEFLAGLSRGESMWSAFNRAFPGLTEAQIASAMKDYVQSPRGMRKDRFSIRPWAGPVEVQGMAPAEVHAMRAELFAYFGEGANSRQKVEEELAQARVLDPANPLLLALSGDKANAKLAVEKHPEDWRSWEVAFDAGNRDIGVIRKAAQLAPSNGGVLTRLALAEQAAGQSREAMEHAERAVALLAVPFSLDALAAIYEKNGRCGDAAREEARALDAFPDHVDKDAPAALRARLKQIEARAHPRPSFSPVFNSAAAAHQNCSHSCLTCIGRAHAVGGASCDEGPGRF